MNSVQLFLNRNKKALTLVEILVVILIIAILIVALVPRVTAALDKSKETQVRTDFRNFSLAAESVLREYAGFTGVPLQDSNGKTLATLGEEFWNKGLNIGGAAHLDTGALASTQSIIKSMNRYLESNYQFEPNRTAPTFGRSKANDPWKKAYEVYFVSRDFSQADDHNTDKIYIVCNGKTLNPNYPDYSMICEYKDGEVRTATAGFGETLPTDYTVFAGQLSGKNYVLIGSVFRSGSATSGMTAPTETVTPGTNSIFDMNSTAAPNIKRLWVQATTGGTIPVDAENATP